VRIKAYVREMADNEIAVMVGTQRMAQIKMLDPKPVFKAFVIGHEGEAGGYMVGVGNIVKRWFRSAVEKLYEKIQMGIKIFQGHGATNDQTGRVPIGEVAGKRLMTIGNRISTVVACHIFPEFAHLPLDIASIEASVDLEEDKRRGLYVADVGDVTAIALSNSKIETPGFAGATLLGQLQAFAKTRIKENQLDKPTTEEIKSMIREAELQPSDLFGLHEIKADPIIKEQMTEESPANYKFALLRREKEDAERRLAELKTENTKLNEKVIAQDQAIKASQIESAKGKVTALFEKAKGERKLEERQSKFIQSRLARFVPVKPEEVEKEFNTFLDGEIDEEKRIAKDVYGIEVDKGNGGKGAGGEADDKTKGKGAGGTEEVENPYLDPAKNPMIKLD
jgi:hypothetical protein